MEDKRRGKRAGPERIGGPLDRALDEVAPRGRRMIAVLDRWRVLVSPATLDHARPTSIRRNVLYVTVTEPVWMAELTYFVPKLLEALNASLHADDGFSAIRLRVGSLPSRPPERRPAGPPPPAACLPGSVRARLERIEDPDLREQMARIAARLTGGPGRGTT